MSNGYIPWHKRIDEDLVKEITEQFVQRIHKEAGMRVTTVRVNWSEDGKDFNAQTFGHPTAQNPPE